MTLEQIEQAIRYLDDPSLSYSMVGIPIPMPYSFEIKQETILFEIERRELQAFVGYHAEGVDASADIYCYSVTDAGIAKELSALFDTFQHTEGALSRNAMRAWLQKRFDDEREGGDFRFSR